MPAGKFDTNDVNAVLGVSRNNIHQPIEQTLEELDYELPVEDDVVYTREAPDLKAIPPPMDGGNKVLVKNKYKKGKRTITERERDLVDEQRMYLEGHSYMEIAIWIGENRPYSLGLGQIGRDVLVIQDRWRLAYLGDMNEMKVRELKKIDRVEVALWGAWDKSLLDIVEVERTKIVGVNDTDEGKKEDGTEFDDEIGSSEDRETSPSVNAQDTQSKGKTNGNNKKGRGLWQQGKGFVREKSYEKRTTTYGDIRIMEQVLKCVELRARILGLITNKSAVSVSWKKDAEDMGFDPEQVINEFRERIIDSALARGRVLGSDEGQQARPPELPDGR